MEGRGRISEFLAGVRGADLRLRIADEVLGTDRVAFSVDCVLPDGRRVFEHVIARI